MGDGGTEQGDHLEATAAIQEPRWEHSPAPLLPAYDSWACFALETLPDTRQALRNCTYLVSKEECIQIYTLGCQEYPRSAALCPQEGGAGRKDSSRQKAPTATARSRPVEVL